MNLNDLKTLTGLTLDALAQKLDEQLPASAYKAVPGGADLTDINPNHMNDVLNACFGLCGIGWGYAFDPTHLEIVNTGSGKMAWSAVLKYLTVWFALTDASGAMQQITIASSGGSDNSTSAYAMKGAITSAIAAAVSKIGFQKSVYLGARSHHTVGGGKKTASTTTAIKSCPIHNIPMKKYTGKNGGDFYAHKTEDGAWCRGETKPATK